MAKAKSVYRCEQCGADHPKWSGQCAECGEWNSLLEVTLAPATTHRAQPKIGGYAGQASTITTLNKVSVSHETRMRTGIGEFDRVLGGGLVTGSVVLIGGDPGIGKSTILLQTATHMASANSAALYVTGEESLSQVALRAQRLDLPTDHLQVMAETGPPKLLFTDQALKKHQSLTKAQSSLLVQARTGTIGLRAFLFQQQVPGIPTPYYTCREGRETVEHLVI